MLEAYCDGSITGSHWAKSDNKDSLPHAWSGWWVRDSTGHVLGWRSIDLGEGPHMSANVAEYMAVRSVLAWLLTTPWHGQVIEVISDSQTIIRQLTGEYNCYDPKLLILRDQCLKLAKLFPYVKYRWVRREQNREADVLSKALQLWGRQPTWSEVLERVAGRKVKKSSRRSAVQDPEAGK